MRVTGCLFGHRWVVAAGRCAACGCQLLACGPIDGDEPGLVWLAAPFTDRTASRRCRSRISAWGGPEDRSGISLREYDSHIGRGEGAPQAQRAGHVPAHAVGVCADCGTRVEALGDVSVGREVWVL